jgi:hypothetical protein
MYRIDFGRGVFKNSIYFVEYQKAKDYCDLFKWDYKRIKPVH